MPDLRQECKDTIKGALGRDLTPAESKGIIPALRSQMAEMRRADPSGYSAMTLDEIVAEAAARVTENLKNEAAQRKYRARLAIVQAEKNQTKYKNLADKGLYGYRAVAWILQDTYKKITGVRQQYFSQMAAELRAALNPKFFGLIEDRANALALVKELRGEDSGNPVAKKAAPVISKVFSEMRTRFNRAGGNIGLLADWALPQSHDADKIVKAANRISRNRFTRYTPAQNMEAWVNFISDKLDRSRYISEETGELLNDEEFHTMLQKVYTTLVTDGNGDQFGSRVIGQGARSRANKYGQHRALHFKSAEAYIEYETKFGTGSVMQTITSRINSMSKDIALLESLGPNPTNTYRTLHQIAGQDLERARATDTLWARRWKYRDANGALGVSTEAMWQVLSGEANRPAGTGLMASIGQGARNLQVAGKLGGAVISSLSDLGSYYVTLEVNGISPLKAPFSLITSFSRADREFAARAGLLADNVCAGASRWYDENVGSGLTGVLADATIRMSLLGAWTNLIRQTFSLNYMAATGKLAKSKAWDELSTYDRARLERGGMTEQSWNLLRLAKPEKHRGVDVLTRDAIEKISDADLEANGFTRAQRDKVISDYLSMVSDESYMASLEPDLATRAGASRGKQAGTVDGEFWRSLMLFKSFPFAMLTRHWSRGSDLWMSGNKGGAMLYGASIVASTTLFGALSLQAANLLAGRDMQDSTTADFWMNAMMKGGGLGIFGDMLYNGVFGENAYGSPNVLSFLGPVAGSAFDTWDVAMSMRDAAMYDKDTKWGQKALRLVRGNTPFANVWWIKHALDHAVMNDVNEMLSPGYNRRQRNRAMRQYGQDYWWPQQQMFPERAPRMADQPRR